MPWHATKTWVPSEVLTTADVNKYWRDNLNFLNDPPQVVARRNTPQSMPNNVTTPVSFNDALADTDTMWSALLSTRATIVTPAKCDITAFVRWSSNNTGRRLVLVARNDGFEIGAQQPANSGDPTYQTAAVGGIPCSAGQWWELRLNQVSGAPLNVDLAFLCVKRTGA